MKHKSALLFWKFQKKVFVNRSNDNAYISQSVIAAKKNIGQSKNNPKGDQLVHRRAYCPT